MEQEIQQGIQITLTWQSILGAAAIIGAVMAIINYLRKLFGWFDKQEDQETEIREIKEEQALLTEGILACLKGLKEQGCNGPVTEAIDKIEQHLNKKAHGGKTK